MKKIYSLVCTRQTDLLKTVAVLVISFFTNLSFSQTVVVVNPSSPWTVPANVTSVKVEVWGGGGGGGLGFFGGGGGAGGGAYSISTLTVSPFQQYTLSIGKGGVSDNDGKPSVFTGIGGTVTANGGKAGNDNFSGDGSGGSGGIGNYNGGNGQAGSTYNQYGGGGAGNNASGTNAGVGGTGNPNLAPYVGGNGGDYNSDGSIPGGGGGGGYPTGLFAFYHDGGTGGKGQVVLTYTVGTLAPSILSFSPSTVCAGSGTPITITGINFTSTQAMTVTFTNNIAVSAYSVTSTTLKANLPAGAVTGPIKVSNSIGSDISSTDLVVNTPNVALIVTGAGSDFCENTVISATGGGGGNIYFQGTNPAGTSTAAQSPQTISTVGTNTYYFREMSVCGWGAAYGVSVGINPAPSTFNVNVAATCSSAVLTPSGATGDIFYFQGITAGGTSTATPGQVTVNAAGTYYYRARTALGCWGPDKSVNVVFAVTASIRDQPVSKEVCAGTNTSFSITANSGTTLSYQWRKGTSDIAGAISSTLNFSPATLADAGTDYNCVVTDACGSLISNYVTLTVNSIAIAPTIQATVLSFPTVGVSSLIGIFTASPTATNYLVVRSSNPTLGSSPVNGTSYTVGSTIFGANTYVEYVGPDNTFTSSGLNAGATYYYFVFAFNINNCNGSNYPLYIKPALTGSVITATNTNCGSVTTLYWAGDGSAYPRAVNSRNNNFQNKNNWSTSKTAYVYANAYPTKCNNVDIKLNGSVNISLSDDAEFSNLSFIVLGNSVQGSFYTRQNNLTVYGNAILDITNGNSNTGIAFGENNNNSSSIIDFKANVDIGSTDNSGASFLIGNQNSTIIVRGDLKMGPTFALSSSNIDRTVPGTLMLDGTPSQQISWNNTRYYAKFNNLVIGNTYSPIISFVNFPGRSTDNILGDLTINNSSVLDLGLSQLNNDAQNAGTFTMNGSSKLKLSGISSMPNDGEATLATGSNFPSGFSYSFNGSSTVVEYNGKNDVTQTVYNIPTYKNLTLTNGSGSGTANKINAAAITISGTSTINNNVTHTMNAGIVNNGTFNVTSSATLLTGSKFMTGTGAFNLNSGGTIGLGDAGGITTSPTVLGNIRNTGGRIYNAGATYIYNGALAQSTGNGLPLAPKVLSIVNATGVTISGTGATYSPATYNQTTGPLALNGNTLTINNLIRNSGTISGSETSGVTVNGTAIPIFMTTTTEPNSTLKTLSLNGSKTANINTALNITGGLSAGNAGAVILGSGATLTTGDKLVLKSNKFGTAYIAPLPVDGSGVAQAYFSGKVSVERYINTGNTAGTHGKSWQLLATPTYGQTIRDAWQEGGVYNPGYGIELTGTVYTTANHHGFDAYTPGSSIKTYNSATDQYTPVPNTDAIQLANPGGYYVYVRGDRSVTVAGGSGAISNATNLRSKGTLFTGIQPAITIAANKYGTVGNPYAAPIDLRVLRANSQNVANEVYIWDPTFGGVYGAGGFRALTWIDATVGYKLSGFSNMGTYPGPYVDTMQSGQAFFVKSNGTGLTKVTFTEAAKVGGQANGHLVNGVQSPSPALPAMLEVNLAGATVDGTNTQFLDGALAIFGEAYSNNLDEQDGAKISNGSNNVGFLQGGKFLSVERRQLPTATDTLSLYLTNSKVQAYTWNFSGENIDVPGLTAYLWDRYLNTKTPFSLTAPASIDFSITSVAASAAADRFKIVFSVSKPLPVTLVSVAAKRNSDKTISVNWQTANEINLQQYVVERSSTGSSFEALGNQPALNNNGGGSNYVYADNVPLPTDNYYRIRAVSKDGAVQYSPVVKVVALLQAASISVYPNPVVDRQMYISFVNQPKGNYNLELLNKLGQLMYKGTVNVTGNLDKKKVSLVNVTAGGAYQLLITAKDGTVNTVQLLINND